MEIIQECAQNFKELSDTTSYTFHTSLGKKISVFDVDFKPGDFHHAAGLQYLTDISKEARSFTVSPPIFND